jgi:TIR domain
MSAGGIFICYRHEDSQGEAGRIDDHLRGRYGAHRVFRDVYGIPIGRNFPDHLARTVAGCGVVIVVIGRHWLEFLLARPDRPDDWLRMEIRTALGCPDVTVIPVLVQGATMPASDELPDDIRAIATIAAQELSDSRWGYDMSRLAAVIDELVPPVTRPPAAGSEPGGGDRVSARLRGGADTNRASTAAWVAGIVLMCGIGIGLTPAIVAARAEIPAELFVASLAGAVLSTSGAAAACVALRLRQIPHLRAVALALLVVGTMLVSIGAGAALQSDSGGPPRPPPGCPPGPPPGAPPGPPPPGCPPGPPPGGQHGPPPGGAYGPPPTVPDGPSLLIPFSVTGESMPAAGWQAGGPIRRVHTVVLRSGPGPARRI